MRPGNDQGDGVSRSTGYEANPAGAREAVQAMSNGGIHIGTSGWAYDHWKGRFFPERIGSDAMLAEYARHFDCVELNSTFYRMPSADTLRRWADTVPGSFRFAVKASRYITHIKKLKDSPDTLATFLERVRGLGDRLGPILFQLPPRFRFNRQRLETLLEVFPDDLACAFEFRDESWFADAALALLDQHGAALCHYDLGGRRAPTTAFTGRFGYLRLHGPEQAYEGRYSDAALDEWARTLHAWTAEGHDVWCFFDNDAEAHAPSDALRLRERLAGP